MGIPIIKPAHKGQLGTHSAGQLQCSTKQHAEQFKCIFASKACTYTHGLREASCLCSLADMEELMKASPLPLVSKSFVILSRNKQVYAKPNIESTLQLHLVAENMKITTHLSNTTCEIETSDIIGCYDCVTGAEVSLYCRSSEGQTIANIEYPTENQVALRTANGHLNKLVFHFATSIISTECIASCPGGTVKFTVKGTLQFVNYNLLKGYTKSETVTRNTPKDMSFLDDLPDVLSFP
ncbi:hypothetical protein ANCCEY_11418 [Ancylostoma ceylanicum]|uniref:Phlebovirus glycoprotein G2 fusion domain-containing protein n=1 Tax=Ancylostoma ceylanicum TaxID=53326 RepID=A0A0D6LBN3_9BILA|nr:hypothetical protein ANCCEY_11418 [Ancylostoma ceylanicum]